MRHVFIFNPCAGKAGAVKRMLPIIERAARLCGVKAETVFTEAPRHATRLAGEYALAGGPVRLYAVGGDGTLNEVLAGARHYEGAQVASVPCGSGNDFIRCFGAAEDFLNIASQIKGTAVAIDLIEADSGICAAITSVGLDADVAYGIPKYRRIPLLGGSMAYNISIAERLLGRLGRQLEITIDGKKLNGRYLVAAVCNARYYGGGFLAAPMASPENGRLDVVLVKKISRLLIPSVMAKYKKGGHWQNGAIIPAYRNFMAHYSAQEVEITQAGGAALILNADGECAPAPRLYAKVIPGAARFVLPEHLAKAREKGAGRQCAAL